MRVLVGPLAELQLGRLAVEVAERLAGPGGTVVSLRKAGVADLSRRLSEAEIVLLREAVLGDQPEWSVSTGKKGRGLAGYVCAGSRTADPDGMPAPGAAAVIAATDHADLTWRSPLTGPNDDLMGPRFPGMNGVYAPEAVIDRLGEREDTPGERVLGEGMIVVPGIVAGVFHDGRLSDHEKEMVDILGCPGVSVELAPVAIVMAHLGLRVAAAVVMCP